MEVVATLPPALPLGRVADHVRRLEALGFDTVHVPETVHDSLAVALLAIEHSDWLTVRTSMTLAFPRSPMVVAQAAWDLAQFSSGRFQLGLGSQVRANIEDRFSTRWEDPVGRMADYLASLRAIFAAFATGERLDHHGPHYRFTRLQPYFRPEGDTPPPALYTGGVNRGMTRMAGATADGFVTHPTQAHPEQLQSWTLPHLEAGARHAGRAEPPRVVCVVRCATGPDAGAVDRAREEIRGELGFLYSTPSYWPLLDRANRAGLGARLRERVRADRWDDLAALVDDELLDFLVPVADWDALPGVLDGRFAGLVDGLGLPVPDDPADDARLRGVVDRVRGIATRSAVQPRPT